MTVIRITREDILGGPLDEERHVLLSMLAELDLAGRCESDKFIRPLVRNRLRELEDERSRLGLADSDPTKWAEAEAAIEAEPRDDPDPN